MHDEVIDRQEPADGQRGRTDLCGLRRARLAGHPRPEDEPHRGARDPDARAARRGAVALPEAESAVAVVGRHASLGEPAVQPGRSAQPDARQQGPRVADVEDSPQRRSRLVLRPGEQVRGVVPAAQQRPSGVVLRSEDEAVHAHRHLLRDAPPAVRQRRERDRVLQRAVRPDRRLDRLKVYDETKDEQKAVGWCGQVVDTNGDGKITAPPWNQITGRGDSILYAGDTTGGGGAPADGRAEPAAARRPAVPIRSSTRW